MSDQSPQANPPLIRVKDLKTHFPIKKGLLRRQVGSVKAVDGVTFDIDRGETLGLVGESGCGKTTVGRSILRLVEPTKGEVTFDGRAVREENTRDLRSLRRRMQIVFQDPYGSLNPRMKIRSILEEGLILHRMGDERDRLEQMKQALERTGLSATVLERYPHEFSGGQRQRIAIARSLVLKPEFLVLDEPVSALDVSIQAQVINLLKELKQELGLTYLFISHDLSVVEYLADNVAVMYLGQIVESAEVNQLCQQPLHPYTLALFSAVPSVEVKSRRQRIVLTGDVPSPSQPPVGCRFHPRCPLAETVCREVEPPQVDLAGHRFHCHVASRELERCGGDVGKTSKAIQAAITAVNSDLNEPYSAVEQSRSLDHQ